MIEIITILMAAYSFSQINWEREVVDSSSSVDFVFNTIAVDHEQRPHIAYSRYAHSKLVYASYEDTFWSKETVDSGFFYYGFSLEFDNGNIPHLAYYRRNDAVGKTYVCYAQRTDSNWTTETVDSSSGFLGSYYYKFNSSIDFDTLTLPGLAYIAWNTTDSLHYIKYAYFDGSQWDTSIVSYDTSWTGPAPSDLNPSLRFDSNNIPHIAFVRMHGSIYDTLKYMKYEDSIDTWTVIYTLCCPSPGFPLSLELDSADYPCIAHNYGGILTYTWWDSLSHYPDYIALIGYSGVEIHLELDEYDNPQIAYLPDMPNRPYYCFRDSIWNLCGPVEPDTYTTTAAVDISLSVDSNNQPHVCYQCRRSNVCYIKYAKGSFVGIGERTNHAEPPTTCPRFSISPNPFSVNTNIIWYLSDEHSIEGYSLRIYDINGRLVQELSSSDYLSTNQMRWPSGNKDDCHIPAGVYFVCLNRIAPEGIGTPRIVRKIVKLK